MAFFAYVNNKGFLKKNSASEIDRPRFTTDFRRAKDFKDLRSVDVYMQEHRFHEYHVLNNHQFNG